MADVESRIDAALDEFESLNAGERVTRALLRDASRIATEAAGEPVLVVSFASGGDTKLMGYRLRGVSGAKLESAAVDEDAPARVKRAKP